MARHQANSRVHSERARARGVKRLKVKEGKLNYENKLENGYRQSITEQVAG